jgi:hypothetical protein
LDKKSEYDGRVRCDESYVYKLEEEWASRAGYEAGKVNVEEEENRQQ